MDKFLPDTLHPVLVTDSELSSHPIVQTVSNPDEITAIFDVITYNKVSETSTSYSGLKTEIISENQCMSKQESTETFC